MSKVTIWYFKVGDPNDISYIYMFSFGKGVKKETLEKTHMKVYETMTDRTEDMNFLNFLDECFAKFNNSNLNPLVSESNQKYIRDNNLHTRLSVGDVIQIGEKFYVCRSIGWKEL